MAKRNITSIFTAPEGYVYDYSEPKMATFKDKDGNEYQEEEHLYAKQLYLGSFDFIEHYKLVKDPKGELI